MKGREAQTRVARRALAGAALLPVEERIQLFEDVSTILPTKEADLAKLSAFTLREAIKNQRDFLVQLLGESTEVRT